MVGLQETFVGGYYTSTGSSVNIPLRFDPDYFELLNYTQMATTQNPGRVVRSSWQRGFTDGYALTGTKTNASNAMNETIATSGGFTRINTAAQTQGAAVAFTAGTNATPPVISTGSTAGLINGDTVRIINSATAPQVNGLDFTIDNIVANTSFELIYMVAPGSVFGAGSYRKIYYDPVWSPRSRYITAITQAAQAVVTLSVTHGYVVGEKIQFNVGTEFGMTQINGLVGEITAINTTTNTVTVDIDSTAFTAFAWPAAASYPFSFAQTIPVGEIPTITSGSTLNNSLIGINVGSAVAGSNNDVMYWRAWKSFEYHSGTIPSAT